MRDGQLHEQNRADRRQVGMVVARDEIGQLPTDSGGERRLEHAFAHAQAAHLRDELRQEQSVVCVGSWRDPIQWRYPRVMPAITTFVIIMSRSFHSSIPVFRCRLETYAKATSYVGSTKTIHPVAPGWPKAAGEVNSG